MPPTRIILDTQCDDPDGAFTLSLASTDPRIQLDMVTTVHGKTDIDYATIVTATFMGSLGIRNTPLFRGSETAILGTNQNPTPTLPAYLVASKETARKPNPGYAPVAIAEHIMAHPGEITVVAMGALTNVAIALLLEPRIKTAMKELVVMQEGLSRLVHLPDMPGTLDGVSDPEAARAVLMSGVRQRYITLECISKARLTMADFVTLTQSPSRYPKVIGDAFTARLEMLATAFPGGARAAYICMHSPLVMACVSRPDLCEYKDLELTFAEGKEITITETLKRPDQPEAKWRMACDVDANAFRAHVMSVYLG